MRRRSTIALAAVAIGCSLGVVVGSPTVVVGLPLLAAGGWHQRRSGVRRRRSAALADELPRFVDALIQRLKVGGSLAEAIKATNGSEPFEATLAALRQGLAVGRPLREALEGLVAHSDTQSEPTDRSGSLRGFQLFATTMIVLVERGGPALPSLERLNNTLRSARWIESEVEAQAAQATASALLLAALPGVFVVALGLMDDGMADFYIKRPAGTACILVAGCLSYLGWLWMQRLTGPPR